MGGEKCDGTALLGGENFVSKIIEGYCCVTFKGSDNINNGFYIEKCVI